MSEFRRYWTFIKKSQREQVSELRKWSDSFSLSPATTQTKPISADTVQSVSLATDARVEGVTADDVSDAGEREGEAVDKAYDLVESVVVEHLGDESKDNDDEVFVSVEDAHDDVLQQIAIKEKSLLKIWEDGPAQLTMSQSLRIAYLEEKLLKASEDNKYLEALLEVRDADFARYLDLERKQRRHVSRLQDEVDMLDAQLDEKDRSLRLALRKVDMIRKADTVSMELSKAQMQLAKSTLPALESSASVSATDGQIDSWRAVLLYQLLKQDTSQQTKQTNKQTAKLPAS